MKLSTQEKKDLDKYTKFLALKSTQIIVQSRLGEKISTPCKPNTQGSDWFNLNINDIPEVVVETKKALNVDKSLVSAPLCVEISLHTPEKDKMILEYWCLSLLPEQYDTSVRIIHAVYNRMGILLKSLVSVTRVTPAYKLSRRQGLDSYVILYHIRMVQPDLHGLGDGYKQVRIGQICTPIGTLQLSVAYRTKMTISPTQTGKNNAIMVKSDHFNSNSNPRRYKNNDDINDLTKPMRPGPFADPKPKKPVEPQLPGVTRLLQLGKYKPRPVVKPPIESDSLSDTTLTEEDSESKNDNINDNEDDNKDVNIDDNKDVNKDDNKNDNKNDNENDNSVLICSTKMATSTSSKVSTAGDLKSVGEEYWMKELSAPFATRGPVGELMQFYKQCKKSPPLQSPQKNPTPEEITKMIEMYESQLPEYDALVQSFCESPDNN